LRFRSRRYRATRAGPKFPGPFPEYTAALVEAWQEADDDRLKEVIRQMELMELALDVAAERHSDVEIELQVRQRGARMVSVADTGLGVSQALPVLMALRVARQGQLLHIEQPELHLHPNAQVRLVSALAAAASRGVRVVVETHSSLLLKAVQVAISEGHLPPSLVALHWFTQDEAGATRITSAYPDEIGAYGDWPVDFASVELGIEERFIRASLSHAG
jgi:predicted ATPase